jgi:hypothetical protein
MMQRNAATRWPHFAIAFGFLVLALLSPTRGAGETVDKARATLSKAIKAHGGKAALARLRTHYLRAEGQVDQGGKSWQFKIEGWHQAPDRNARRAYHKAGGEWVADILVLNGARGWSVFDEEKRELSGKELEAAQGSFHFHEITRLYPLLEDRKYALRAVPDKKVNGRESQGVEVTTRGQPPARLFFDKNTSLLVKIELMATTPGLKDLKAEVFLSNYQDIKGVKYPMKTQRNAGMRHEVIRVLELRLLEKIDAKAFDRPWR